MICPKCRSHNDTAARYCNQCGGLLAQPAESGPALRGERRQLTALFCDIVQSTALAGSLDPEEYQDVLKVFADCVRAEVARHDGHVQEFRGDGALVFFGYPAARGNEPERAIRAALAILAAVERTPFPRGLRIRIGVATGLMAIDASAGADPVVVGEALNLAARIQNLAEPGTVVVAALTHQLAGSRFEFADLGEHELKGFAAPIHVWRVGASRSASRLDALHADQTAFVGRQTELRRLKDLWDAAAQGGCIALLSGEAGIGKSRLIKQAQRTLAAENRAFRFYCSPYHTTTVLHPVVEQLARGARFAADDSAEERLAKLRRLLARAGEGYEEQLPWFAALLSPLGVATQPANIRDIRARIMEALLWWLRAASREKPLLLIVEDAHWADATSLQLIKTIAEQRASMRVLAIVSMRPPFTLPIAGEAFDLDRLSRAEAGAMIASIPAARALPPDLASRIVEKTDGVPLFVEELTRMVVDDAQRAVAAHAARTELPSTLHDSLAARLDQLGPAKRIAQIAAVIGRDFSTDILSDVSAASQSALDEALGGLLRAGLIYPAGTAAERAFAFKHALVRDAAYESLLRRDRRDLHAAVAAAFERLSTADAHPELLAHHYTEAGLAEPALKHRMVAARRSLRASAVAEALDQASRALDLVLAQPDSPERRHQELEFRLLAGWAYWGVTGFGSVEVEQTFLRAQELAAEIGDPAMSMYALRGLYTCAYARGALKRGYEIAEQEIALAEVTQDSGDKMLARWAMGCIHFWSGNFVGARRELEASLLLYDPVQVQTKILGSQIEPTVNSNLHLGFALWFLGFPDQGLATSNRAVSDARQAGHQFSLAMSLFFNGLVKLLRGELDQTRAVCDELTVVAGKYGFKHLSVCATVLSGAILVAAGDTSGGVARMKQALQEFQSQQAGVAVPLIMGLMADGHLRAGRPKDALTTASFGLAMAGREGEGQWTAELHRVRGEALAMTDAGDQAEAAIREAIAIAERQGALMLRLRATMSLARLLRTRGDAAGARAVLAPVYAAFSEGFGTADLIEAKALLDELNAPERAAAAGGA